MFSRSSPLRRPNGWSRRFALAALFALQGAIALAPLVEPSEKGRLGAHAEGQGAQHKYQHDESTCAVCAVRSMHSAPAQSAPPVVHEHEHSVALAETPAAPSLGADITALPRAPPQLT